MDPPRPNPEEKVFAVPLDWAALSPDRRQWVVFAASVGDNVNLFRVPVSANKKALGIPEQLTFTLGRDSGARVSADGRMVFSNSVSSLNLWSIPIDADHGRVTGERQRLTQVEGARNENVTVSRDGKKTAFERDSRILVMDLGTGQETQLADGTRPTISPDGSFVVYKGKGGYSSGSDFYLVSSAGGAVRQICSHCADLNPKGISSDGSRLLAEGSGIELIDIASGQVKSILSAAHPLWHPYFSWDDKWMTFKMQLDAHPSEIAQHFRIYITPVRDFIPAGESQWIALTSGEYSDDKPQLSPDGNTLYFTSNRDGYNCFWAQRLDPRTKHPVGAPFAIQHLHHQQTIPSIGNTMFGLELSVARDKIVTDLDEFHSDIWMMQLLPGK